MATTQAELHEWLAHHIATRNQIRADVIDLVPNSGGWDYYLKTKTGEQTYLVMPALDVKGLTAKVSPTQHAIIITANTPESLQATINGWDDLITMRRLTIFFVNPHAAYDKHWALQPAAHESLIGRKNLSGALRTLFESITPCH